MNATGCVAALDHWWNRDHDERLQEAHRKCERLCAELAGVPGVTPRIDESNTETFDAYGVDIGIDSSLLGIDALTVIEKLKAGDPAIWTRPTRSAGGGGGMDVHVSAWSLFEGEEVVVGQALRELATTAAAEATQETAVARL